MFQVNVEKCLSIFKDVYVSSDSVEILGLAESLGAIGIQRGLELCGDTPNIPVYQHALKNMKGKVDVIVAVQANSPTIKKETIIKVKEIMELGFNEVMTCDEDYKIYGSVWALTTKKLKVYKGYFNPKPDVLVLDRSIDIHTQKDYNEALKQKI